MMVTRRELLKGAARRSAWRERCLSSRPARPRPRPRKRKSWSWPRAGTSPRRCVPGDDQVFSGLLALAGTPVELAETKVALDDEGAHKSPTRSGELLEHRLGFTQVGSVETLSEAVVDVGERLPRFVTLALPSEQPAEARRRPELPPVRALMARDVDRLPKARLSLRVIRWRARQE